jgi:molybdopterin molybdotransferase
MLSATAASEIILNLVQPLTQERDQEWVELAQAGGRVLASAVTSERDFPYWDNSAMDGYAVYHADIATCHATAPARLPVVMEIPAGTAPGTALLPGQAARIFTGSMLPAGADTIVPQESTQRSAEHHAELQETVEILKPFPCGAFVRYQGD